MEARNCTSVGAQGPGEWHVGHERVSWGACRLAPQGRPGVTGTCVPQVEGAQKAHAVAQPREQGEGASERAAAEEELKVGVVVRPAGAPVAQRHGDLVQVGEQRPCRSQRLCVLLGRHLAPTPRPGATCAPQPMGRCRDQRAPPAEPVLGARGGVRRPQSPARASRPSSGSGLPCTRPCADGPDSRRSGQSPHSGRGLAGRIMCDEGSLCYSWLRLGCIQAVWKQPGASQLRPQAARGLPAPTAPDLHPCSCRQSSAGTGSGLQEKHGGWRGGHRAPRMWVHASDRGARAAHNDRQVTARVLFNHSRIPHPSPFRSC